MKLDDRNIVCEQDYTPLSNAELVEAIERYAAIMHTAPLVDFDLEWITGPARVLLARVEAAEGDNLALSKELIELKERFDAMDSIAQHDQQQLIDMAALVAELEAALETTRQTLVALTARVAELTTERNTTGRRAFNAEAENQRLAAENRRLAARVAELEAQLAAQGWRPVTENPVVTMQYQVVVQHSRQQPTADHMAYYPSSGWTGTDVIFWRPIPPLPPAPQEPTP